MIGNLLQLLKDIEDGKGLAADEEGFRPAIPAIPKFLKEYKTKDELLPQFTGTIQNQNIEPIKNIYLSLGGSWIDFKDSGNTIVINDHLTGNNASALWNKAVEQYINSVYPKEGDLYIISAKRNPAWPFFSLYIDTIDYNVWLRQKEKLAQLQSEYSRLPNQLDNPKEEKDKNGKPIPPYCNKYIPFNFGDIFGVDISTWSPIFATISKCFSVMVPVYSPYQPKSQAQILNQKTKQWEPEYERVDIAILDGYMYIPLRNVQTKYIGPLPRKNAILIPGVGPEYRNTLCRIF